MELCFSGFSQHFVHEEVPFFPCVYDGIGETPDGFNVRLIRLDASEHASLKWKVEAEKGLILWELDFALDEQMWEDEARYLALELAVDHFTQTLWPQFEDKTVGVALYRGPFRESLLEPLKLLAARLPQTVRPFVFFDTDAIADAQTYFRTLNQATLGYLTPILRGKWAERYPFAFPALAWDHPHSPLGYVSKMLHPILPQRPLPCAVLIPEEGEFPILDDPVRMLPESLLTHEWEGIDKLVVVPSAITAKCRRKLCGFEAAGGEVVLIDNMG